MNGAKPAADLATKAVAPTISGMAGGMGSQLAAPMIESAASSIAPEAIKQPMSEAMKAALVSGGMGAGAGLATGLAGALLTPEDPKDQGGHSSIPGGSPATVGGTHPGNLGFGRASMPNQKDYALALLQGRRYT